MRQEGLLTNNVLSYELSSTATQIRDRGGKQAKNHVLTSHVLFCNLHQGTYFFYTSCFGFILHKIPTSTFIRLDLQFSFIVSFLINQY